MQLLKAKVEAAVLDLTGPVAFDPFGWAGEYHSRAGLRPAAKIDRDDQSCRAKGPTYDCESHIPRVLGGGLELLFLGLDDLQGVAESGFTYIGHHL